MGLPMSNSAPSMAVCGVLTVISAVSHAQKEAEEPKFTGK